MEDDYDIVPEFRVRWSHDFGDLERPVSARFAEAPVDAPYTVRGAEVGRDVAVLGLGWSVVGAGNVSLRLDYDVTLNEDLVGHQIQVGALIYW